MPRGKPPPDVRDALAKAGAFDLARLLGLDGACLERLALFAAEPDAELDAGELASVGRALEALAARALDAARDAAAPEMDGRGVARFGDWTFRRRAERESERVDAAAVRRAHPPDERPDLYVAYTIREHVRIEASR